MKKIFLSLLCLFIVTGCGNKEVSNENNETNNNQNENPVVEKEYEEEKVVYELNSKSEAKQQAVLDFTLSYNGKTLTYPFKLKDVETVLGLDVDDYDMTKKVKAGSGLGNIRIYLPDGNITLNVDNSNSKIEMLASECVVDYASTNNPNFTINGITPGKSTYEDVLKVLGRDDENRKNTYKNEVLRQEKINDFDNVMSYSARDENYKYARITLNLDFDTIDGKDIMLDKVRSITYER